MANQEVAENKTSPLAKTFGGVREYFEETVAELRKVHWPTRQEVRNLTTVVITVMLAMALLLGLFDFLFGELMIRVLNLEIVFIAILVAIALAILVLVLFASRER
jgi:preprotein translocase subunit SecE